MTAGMTNGQRAEVLVEALPYIQQYNQKIVVVKYGGNAMINAELKHAVMRDMVLLSLIGVKVVLVHGGGPEISQMLKRVGKESVFVDGLRVTDEETAEIVQMVLAGKIMIHLTFDYKTDEKCTTPGQYLKYHRTFQGLTTRELAEKVGIVPATLVLYENDRHPIKHDIAVALANTLGIDRNRLLDEYTAFVDYPYSSLLKKVRHELSLTQMQMAEVIGIGQTTYSGWEREARVPRRKEHDKILAALKKLKVNVDTYICQSASI